MKKKLSEESKPKTKKVQFNLHAPEAERAFWGHDADARTVRLGK
jgi:hypothetical protein